MLQTPKAAASLESQLQQFKAATLARTRGCALHVLN